MADRKDTAREYVLASFQDAHRALNDIRDLLPSTGLPPSVGLTDELATARTVLLAAEELLKELIAESGGEPA
jgi:hypothetical protein